MGFGKGERLFGPLLSLGCKSSIRDELRKCVRFSNFLTLLLITTTIPYVFLFYFVSKIHSVVVVGFLFLYALTFVFNYFGRFHWARVSLLASVNIGTFIYSAAFGQESGIHLFYIVYPCLSVLMFEYRDRLKIFLSALTSLVGLVSLHALGYEWGAQVPLRLASGFYPAVLVSIMFIIFASIWHYFRLEQLGKEKLASSDGALRESLATSERLAQQSSFATLVRGIAHEIKNPLALMMSRSELVLENLDDKESVAKFADVIVRNMERLKVLVTSMLDYGETQFSSDPESFSLEQMMSDIRLLSGHSCKEKGIELEMESAGQEVAHGNRVFIYQALLNVVVNAIQYTPQGGSIKMMTKSAAYRDPAGQKRAGVMVHIQDTGKGISSETLPRIFDPYFTTKETPENTGLGLPMTFRVITENKGHIDVQSEKGKGTDVRVYLPQKEA
ncbi:MAG: signal transduction histidine kinase [Candidatus Marinamargulisbacteria bacterium]|jgi:signal transduction histidine kinase